MKTLKEENPVPSIHVRQGNCGCFCFRLPCLQRFCHINVFMVVFSTIFILSLSVAGYLAGVISTLERRFQLKSTEVGAISTVSSSVSLALVVFVAYFGQTRHRPRIIAFGAVLVGIGTLLMSFPQFFYDTPEFLATNSTEDSDSNTLCHVNAEVAAQRRSNSSDNACNGIEDVTSSSSYGVGWLILGQVLIGIGGSVFMPLSITFIDDNVPKTSTAFYVGVLFAASGIAPILGFGFSSICLSYYNDFYKTSSINITSDDPLWLGAWWLGFLIYGMATLALSVPMFMFPKRISEQIENEEDVNENNQAFETVENGMEEVKDMFDMTVYRPTSFPTDGDDNNETCGSIKGFLRALYRICTNPAYIIVVAGVCLSFAALSGFFTFGAKYIETQYGVPTASSPLILAGMVAPGGIIGNFLGGYIVKQLRLDTDGYARMILIILIPMTCLTPVIFFLGCDNPRIAGLTSDYYSEYAPNVNKTHLDLPNFIPPTSSCNSFCQCETIYSPVCGSDGITYASPCYAGCNEATTNEDGDKTTYQGCGCITYSNHTDPSNEYSAIKGECSRDCHTLWLFTGVFALIFFFQCISSNPTFMLYLRIVDKEDRSIAVGFASLAIKALGFIPAPIFYGKAIQSTCLWSRQLSCEETGECLLHDIWQFRFNFLGLTYGLQVLVTVLMIMGYFAVKRQTRGFQRIQLQMLTHPSIEPSRNRGTRASRLPSSLFGLRDSNAGLRNSSSSSTPLGV